MPLAVGPGEPRTPHPPGTARSSRWVCTWGSTAAGARYGTWCEAPARTPLLECCDNSASQPEHTPAWEPLHRPAAGPGCTPPLARQCTLPWPLDAARSHTPPFGTCSHTCLGMLKHSWRSTCEHSCLGTSLHTSLATCSHSCLVMGSHCCLGTE